MLQHGGSGPGGDELDGKERRSLQTALSLPSLPPPPSSPPSQYIDYGEIPVLLYPATSLSSFPDADTLPMSPLGSTIHPSLTSLPSYLATKPSALQRSRSVGHNATPFNYYAPEPESPPSSPSPSSSVTDLTGLSGARLNPSRQSNDSHPSLDDLGLATTLAWQASWLRETVVELWIDQEGFRAIKPQFTLARCVASDSPTGRAEFLPRVRQAYNFHYSPLDAPPVLRRLTLNGSQSYDHISRQAHLILKSNGVYILNGRERKGRSTWNFEYVVQDRLARTGKVIKGEKVFIPLSFSCSPEILAPEHGKRIKLLHVMRKKVVPKLSSWKLEPPPHTFHPNSAEQHGRDRGGSAARYLGNLFKRNKDPTPVSCEDCEQDPSSLEEFPSSNSAEDSVAIHTDHSSAFYTAAFQPRGRTQSSHV